MMSNLSFFSSDYFQKIPTKIPLTALQGFLLSVAWRVIPNQSMNEALVAGTLAATATVIEALSRPIMQSLYPKGSVIGKLIQIYIPSIVTVEIAKLVFPSIRKMGFLPIVGCAFSSMLQNYLFSEKNDIFDKNEAIMCAV